MKIDSLLGIVLVGSSPPPMNIERRFIDSDAYKTYAPQQILRWDIIS